MGGSSNNSPEKMKCFYYSDEYHLVNDCPWKGFLRVASCPDKIYVFWSSQKRSKGCRFLRCKGQPKCQAFKWADIPETEKKESETSSSSKVKVTMEGKRKMVTYEGQVNDVIELMNKKLSM